MAFHKQFFNPVLNASLDLQPWNFAYKTPNQKVLWTTKAKHSTVCWKLDHRHGLAGRWLLAWASWPFPKSRKHYFSSCSAIQKMQGYPQHWESCSRETKAPEVTKNQPQNLPVLATGAAAGDCYSQPEILRSEPVCQRFHNVRKESKPEARFVPAYFFVSLERYTKKSGKQKSTSLTSEERAVNILLSPKQKIY